MFFWWIVLMIIIVGLAIACWSVLEWAFGYSILPFLFVPALVKKQWGKWASILSGAALGALFTLFLAIVAFKLVLGVEFSEWLPGEGMVPRPFILMVSALGFLIGGGVTWSFNDILVIE